MLRHRCHHHPDIATPLVFPLFSLVVAWPGIFSLCIRPGLRFGTVSIRARGSRRLRRCSAVDAIRVGVVIRSLSWGERCPWLSRLWQRHRTHRAPWTPQTTRSAINWDIIGHQSHVVSHPISVGSVLAVLVYCHAHCRVRVGQDRNWNLCAWSWSCYAII